MTHHAPHKFARRAFLAAAAILMIAMPASAQLSILGSASGEAEAQASSATQAAGQLESTSGELESTAYGATDTQVKVYQELDIRLDAPEVDIEGKVYQVISYADMLLAEADSEIHACGSLEMTGSIEPPAHLASYSELCGHFDAKAVASTASGVVHSVQLPDSSWITAPDLHLQATADIEADGSAAGEVASEAKGQVDGMVGFVQETAAKIEASFKASVSFFGSLF